MKREEMLLTILAEECMEVAQRCTKALRFGLQEVQPGQPFTNTERIEGELADLMSVYNMLMREGHFHYITAEAIVKKEAKVEKYLKYSKECGTLES